jgi:hydrogenase nickel incorporation protein HypA/HybF
MHELSIALSIVDGVLEEAERRGLGPVETVHLRVGRLSGVDKDALLFSYRVACENTALADSRLVIDEVDVLIHCPKCLAERATQSFPLLVCDECGSLADNVVHGEELEICSLEVAA